MKLSVVIPAWNDPEGLRRLLQQIADMAVFSQVIVVDDASDPACPPESLGIDLENYPVALDYLRLAENRGAGYARNQGLARATGDHVIFFDSDDLFTEEFPHLISRLQSREFDFCIFKHVDSRIRDEGGYGMLPGDEQRWQNAQAKGSLGLLAPIHAGVLCTVAAYPWNKIYRTGFLRDNDIHCTEISIHNDIELHWMGFLRAETILYSDLQCCEHFVAAGERRLTNRSGAERFEVLQALAKIQDEFANHPQLLPYLGPFVSFYTGLFGWINEQLESELQAPFHQAVQMFYSEHLNAPLYSLACLDNPVLGARINNILKGNPL